MQTNVTDALLKTPQGQQAQSILRACVHCGFCTATCPTYQLLGDELDSPRGRIYLIKQVLEGKQPTLKTRTHLDRCLTCRACETTCPSGVKYAQLVDIGRELVEQQVPRGFIESAQRYLLRQIIPYQKRFLFLLTMGRMFKPVLPGFLREKIPSRQRAAQWPDQTHQRKMLVLTGCAQQVVTPRTNSATASVLNHLGIELIEAKNAACCGAVSHHLNEKNETQRFIKQNIDAWWPRIEQGVETIISTASGCGVMLKDYGHLMADDPQYAEKARRISELAKDISEVLSNEHALVGKLSEKTTTRAKIAFHSPCTLQHGLQINGLVENILKQCGYLLTQVNDAHLCCGSAGTYSILQPALSGKLLNNKVQSLEAEQPDFIVTANIGCQMHLNTKSSRPVMHWIELIEQVLEEKMD